MKRIHEICGKSALKPNYFSISTDNRTLITNAHSLVSGEDQYENVNFWDLATGELIRVFDFRHDHISFGCNERWLLGIVYNANAIITLNLTTEEYNLFVDAAPSCLSVKENNISPLAISPYEPIFVCGDFVYNSPQTGNIKVYNLLAEPISQEIGSIRLPVQKFRWNPQEYPACNSSVLISPDSKVMLSQTVLTHYGFHHLWDLQTGELIRTFDVLSCGLAECLAVNKMGQILACGWRLGQIQIWDILTGNTICSIDGHLPVTMTMNGRLLTYCNIESKIVVWDIESNQELWTLNNSSTKIERITISPDGKWAASYNQDQTIEIWCSV
ncbi:WD40 repeat domain-containing protein [Anabaena lutea]|uniref:Uncharacterized protein n=1 Tax=Anabaena lutea FACHB-196 TaxID=2692881 RepID=A0ABR8FN56_9NOST|nr:hypothetical protein [Anabaena lutea]MBD2570161.1 hypothetical protein [Anabaena lutea FACHB-196]